MPRPAPTEAADAEDAKIYGINPGEHICLDCCIDFVMKDFEKEEKI